MKKKKKKRKQNEKNITKNTWGTLSGPQPAVDFKWKPKDLLFLT